MKLLLLLLLFVVNQPQSADETAVRKLLENREVAWEKQDVAGLIAPFAEDSDYIDSSGNTTTGRKAIESQYRKIFASAHYKNSRSTQKITKLRFVKPDVAIVTAEWTLTGLLSNEDTPLPERNGTTVLVIVKDSGDWKIISLHVAITPAEKSN
jgi:uncharacterized protein (TIGR02246 family)